MTADLANLKRLSRKEMAEAVGVSERTVDRELAAAQAWLTKRLRPSD